MLLVDRQLVRYTILHHTSDWVNFQIYELWRCVVLEVVRAPYKNSRRAQYSFTDGTTQLIEAAPRGATK